ncbi:MAG: thioredoxin family protein [Bacteroidetes bacterium]|nr:thioredoxin family protein [Bacteroidota bacterium]
MHPPKTRRFRGMHASLLIGLLALFAFTVIDCGGDTRPGAGTDTTASKLDTLDAGSMDRFLAAGKLAVVEFGGKRCGPCIEMRGILRQLGSRRPDLRLGLVFWEDNPELFEKWRVTLIPAQIIFDRSGREVARHRGVWELDSLITRVDAVAP